ncbi:MAG: hypothetical protein PHH43_00730 [Candidatus Cloacimonetes bacterium]|nr:hypothetical protein [Candidatus Cloacimonadota bacterium]MDD3234835.1 hypothetical protein [Candidatus Cloacimonadota bacterium]
MRRCEGNREDACSSGWNASVLAGKVSRRPRRFTLLVGDMAASEDTGTPLKGILLVKPI